MSGAIDRATAWAATALRFGAGRRASAIGPRPERPIEIYEFEACPFCRKVREAATMLDLPVLVRPCPRGGPRWRARVRELGGRTQFPFMVDPNRDAAMYESSDIVEYLFTHYGDRSAPWLVKSHVGVPTGSLASSLRMNRGRFYRPARQPELPLELWGCEGSPDCKIVREVLCELELVHLQRNVGEGSQARAELVARSGSDRIPWLHDPNDDASITGSEAIVLHLERTYAEQPLLG
jgi:glutathione S-transferase